MGICHKHDLIDLNNKNIIWLLSFESSHKRPNNKVHCF